MTPEEFCKVTLAELEAKSSVSQGRWSLYINKKQSPTFRTISKIADRLNMTPEQLVKSINQRSALRLRQGRRKAKAA